MLDGSPVKEGDELTIAQANQLFAVKIKDYEAAVNKGVKVALTQNQFNALVSLCYNIGTDSRCLNVMDKLQDCGDKCGDKQGGKRLFYLFFDFKIRS